MGNGAIARMPSLRRIWRAGESRHRPLERKEVGLVRLIGRNATRFLGLGMMAVLGSFVMIAEFLMVEPRDLPLSSASEARPRLRPLVISRTLSFLFALALNGRCLFHHRPPLLIHLLDGSPRLGKLGLKLLPRLCHHWNPNAICIFLPVSAIGLLEGKMGLFLLDELPVLVVGILISFRREVWIGSWTAGFVYFVVVDLKDLVRMVWVIDLEKSKTKSSSPNYRYAFSPFIVLCPKL